MGFYTSKLDNYSKYFTFNTDQLEFTKDRIIEQKKQDIEELKRDLQLSRRASIDGDDYNIEEQQFAYIMALKELDFISTMSTPEFYQYLISLENYTLCKIEDKAFDDMANNIKSITKYKSQKGLIAKTSAIFGLNKKMVAKKGKELDDNNLSADFSQDSKKEWQSLSPENQAVYIVGRYEIDKKASFDKEGYENYKLSTYAQTSENTSEEGLEIER